MFARSDAIYIGGQLLDIQHGVIIASAQNSNEVHAAVAGKQILVLAYTLMANGTVNAKFLSAATVISGRKFLIANTGLVAGPNKYGWFETAAGEALNLHLSAGVEVEGEYDYIVY